MLLNSKRMFPRMARAEARATVPVVLGAIILNLRCVSAGPSKSAATSNPHQWMLRGRPRGKAFAHPSTLAGQPAGKIDTRPECGVRSRRRGSSSGVWQITDNGGALVAFIANHKPVFESWVGWVPVNPAKPVLLKDEMFARVNIRRVNFKDETSCPAEDVRSACENFKLVAFSIDLEPVHGLALTQTHHIV